MIYFGKIMDKMKISFGFKLKNNSKIKNTQKGEGNVSVQVTNNYEVENFIFKEMNKDDYEKITKKNMYGLGERAALIPSDNRVSPDLYQIYTAITKLHYLDEEILSKLFIELIAKAADSRYKEKITPAYQYTLVKLSPRNAQLLQFIKERKYIVDVSEDEVDQFLLDKIPQSRNTLPRILRISVGGIPFLEVTSEKPEKEKGYIVKFKIFCDLEKIPFYENNKDLQADLEVLESFGLLTIETAHVFAENNIYKHIEDSKEIKEISKEISKEGRKLKLIQGKIELTEFGHQFLDIVLPNDKIN